MKKRIVFVNLHANAFYVRTLNKILFKRSASLKHRYILDYLLDNENYEVCSFINSQGFSLYQKENKFSKIISKLFSKIEHIFILHKNGIKISKVRVLSKSEIKEDDIIISYINETDTLFQIKDIKAFKVASALHFLGEADISKLVDIAGINLIFDESNLKKHSKAFQAYYTWYNKPVLVHPFVYATRFEKKIEFNKRENKAFSTGTIINVEREDFTNIYKNACNQPTRLQILENKEILKDFIDCYNSWYQEDDNLKKVSSSDWKLVRWYKVFYNMSHTGRQKKYFSFDMVERFNNYKMCIVGEEVVGIPGIGFVEGMSCGCAYIGQTTGYYEDYGMKAGVHYIGYDGTLEDLKAKISYYQQPEHQEELERIANAGYEFAKEHFNGKKVAASLLDKLVKAQAEWRESK